jgi:Sel1 repeat
MRRITIKRARTWHYRKMRPCIEPSGDLALLSPFRSWLGCITNTSGYDFRKGQGVTAMLQILRTLLIGLMLTIGASIVRAGPLEDGNAAYQRGDIATALRLLQPLAEQGNAYAQFSLGVMYANGQGVTQDYKEAVEWYRRSAEQGFAIAQSNLGVMYANGRGVSQDYK